MTLRARLERLEAQRPPLPAAEELDAEIALLLAEVESRYGADASRELLAGLARAEDEMRPGDTSAAAPPAAVPEREHADRRAPSGADTPDRADRTDTTAGRESAADHGPAGIASETDGAAHTADTDLAEHTDYVRRVLARRDAAGQGDGFDWRAAAYGERRREVAFDPGYAAGWPT